MEDRVHELLSERLENIAGLFGQIPDILEDLWIDLALGEMDAAKKTIDTVPKRPLIQLRYHTVVKVDWESCALVLDAGERERFLARGWEIRFAEHGRVLPCVRGGAASVPDHFGG